MTTASKFKRAPVSAEHLTSFSTRRDETYRHRITARTHARPRGALHERRLALVPERARHGGERAVRTREEFRWGACLDEFAPPHDEYRVVVADGHEAMGDRQYCLPAELGAEERLHESSRVV